MDPRPPAPSLQSWSRAGTARYLVGVALLAAAYGVAGKVGVVFPHVAGAASLLWPPTGIAVAVLFRFGLRYWPGVVLGALAVEGPLVDWWAAAGITAGNTLATVATVLMLRRLRFDPALTSQRDPLLFAAAALGGMALSATNGTVWLVLDGKVLFPEFSGVWLVWWVGDAVGVLVFAPPLLTFTPETRRALGHKWEAVGLTLSLVAGLGVAVLCLGPLLGDLPRRYPLALAPAGFMVWVAVRYGAWAASVYAVALAAVALWATSTGGGPFVRPDAAGGLVTLWAYVGWLAGTALVIAGVAAGRDRAEARLRVGEATYRSLVEDNPAMICRLSPAGVTEFANQTYLRAVRLSAAEVVGRLFADGHTPEDRDQLLRAVRDAVAGLPPVTVEVFAPGGRMRWHKWTLTAVGEQSRPPTAVQAVGLDVTVLRQAERQRRVIEEHMFQAQKLESLGVLAGGIAHDFNNILTGILGHAELAAEETPRGSPLHDHLGGITDAARRAADRVRQLMAYAGKGPLAVRPLDLNAVVRDAADLAGVSAPKRCELRFEPGPGLPAVRADEAQVRQLVTSLIINAGEAVGDGPGLIRVRTEVVCLSHPGEESSDSRPGLAPGRYVALRVSDTGCGMTEAVRARVFDPFFSTKFVGRGLGLAAVQGIVKAHRGAVEVESHPGRGTEFTVLLPVATGDDDTATSTPVSVEAGPALVR
ncbi:MAG TPA: MASE1 domain-containing protein [Fimbriiglobus sp.]|nr:MASE1 domain-containing protein [Fimbriiglobus sp.]